ncbi:hypothetical protein FHX82_003108 [Amycolatopsis bartoniae]|uniref:Uncharacterized protein n=1 Tax=Amycolatopsis bartoniae TaxID=941986 RepID=A0A8H9ITY5_9PSEU|nr:hypothetical protein [Amycolatopsis bartoniae]MBB2936054.1 hypothetical protein [Amycolatopsis bartoniae]TVT03543.1 hypothetical protein FNH07_25245 [Amycolatopsis bartoniae]GHF63798.1 hypothetical protein GCM10017566_41840 [Amycolatopsis bartoniae]
MTRTGWLDLGIVLASFVAGGLINWLVRPAKLGNKILIMLVCIAVAVVLVLTVLKDTPNDEGHDIALVSCPRLFDEAHDLLGKQSGLDPPPLAGFAFTPSQDVPGRVDLTLTWINEVPVAQSAVAVQGVYGQADPADNFIDHEQPAAASGECWNWYHFGPRDDAQPKTVRLRVGALWPQQQYCFYTAFRTDAGYSKPTGIRCATATWKPEWGAPAPVPQK